MSVASSASAYLPPVALKPKSTSQSLPEYLKTYIPKSIPEPWNLISRVEVPVSIFFKTNPPLF